MYLFEVLGVSELLFGKKVEGKDEKSQGKGFFTDFPIRKESLLSLACGSIISVTVFELMPDVFRQRENEPIFFSKVQDYFVKYSRATELKYAFIFGI